jgi:hypothetical protein
MKNGLYSIHVSLLDGNTGKGSGVIVFRDGVIRGGDAYLYYTGSYRMDKNGTFKGEVIVNRHTPNRGAENPLFGERQVSIGVTGKLSPDGSGEMEGTALVGKLSVFFRATLRFLEDVE